MAKEKSLVDYFKDQYLLVETTPENTTLSSILDILVDSDALVALAKKDDSNHQKAVEMNNSLQVRGVNYCLSPFTMAEAATVLSYKVTHQAAKCFLNEMKKIDLPILELPANELYLADQWFLNQKNRKGISYFDCYNMALMERYREITAIFSFDAIYRKNGFSTIEGLDLAF